MAHSKPSVKCPTDFFKNPPSSDIDLTPYFEKVQEAQKLLKEIYEETEIFVSIDPGNIICQNGKTTPYLHTVDHVANMAQQFEEMRERFEDLTAELLPSHKNI